MHVYIETERLCALCKTDKLDVCRKVQLNLFMYKQQGNMVIVNRRNVNTRAHDALLLTTQKTNNEKYKQNIFYRGTISWNNLPAIERNINDFKLFKEKQKKNCSYNLICIFCQCNISFPDVLKK